MTQHIFKDNQTVARAFAGYLCQKIKSADQFNLALSGGSTPKILFTILAKEYKDQIDWSKVHLYWGDERCVKPDDKDSNYGMTLEKLIQHIEIPDQNVHRVLGENNPAEEAIRYGNEIKENLDLVNNWPVFDLVILGMGGDGHTASIFPHQINLLTSEQICEVATHPDSGQQRITITGKVINASKEIHFLVTGDSKKEVVKEIFTKVGQYKSYPASHISKAEWWMDASAIH